MQFHAGRPTDKRRSFAALDTSNYVKPVPRHDPARYAAACRHQSRFDDVRDADPEYVGVRREHDDESRYARDDGAGQRHRRRGNARGITAGLLTRAG
jgi:hypothetical protein